MQHKVWEIFIKINQLHNILILQYLVYQAIKHISSGDGGLLCFKEKKILKKAYRMRWFGIDRLKKQGGTWENDIKEIGYKYQMTDLGAAILLDALKEFSKIKQHRKKNF